MKVLQINSVCSYGSTGRIAVDLAKVLKAEGHECLIAYGRGEAPLDMNSYKICSKWDNYIHVAGTRFTDRHGFFTTRATRKLIERIKTYNPDVIHLHNIHGYYLHIGILFDYLKNSNKPVVWTLHDCWAFTGHCAYFDYVGCEKWKKGCFACSQTKKYPAGRLIDSSRWNYQKKKELFNAVENITLVTPSHWLGGLVKKSFLQKYPVKVIPNGIDLDIFKPTTGDFRKKRGLENQFMILGVASIWDRRKGLDTFLELAKMLNDDEVIVLVGLTKNQRKDLPKNIIGITRTSDVKELAEIYTVSDVFVNPTLEDNFPTTNLEALACGTTVITFDTGGSAESINEKTGMVVEKGNLEALMKAIQNSKKKLTLKNFVDQANRYNKKYRFQEYIMIYNATK